MAINKFVSSDGVSGGLAMAPHSDHQVKHLELIQAIVTRLGNGSFLIKGWTMTLAAAFLGISASRSSWRVSAASLVPVVGFWLLDSYYLRQERMFRHLYEDARQVGTQIELFSMNVGPYRQAVTWKSVVLSHTMVNFYGILAMINSASACWLYFRS